MAGASLGADEGMRVLIVSPHPDDDVIGCGGVTRQHALAGDEVAVLYLTSGELGCNEEDPVAVVSQRETEAGLASQVLGTVALWFWHEPDGSLKPSQRLADRLATLIREEDVGLIYAPHPGERHPDHRAAATLVAAVAKQLNGAMPACMLYEVDSPLSTVDTVVEITAEAGDKRAAIRAHKSQAIRNGYDEATLALNHYRGLIYGPNKLYAEAFQRLA